MASTRHRRCDRYDSTTMTYYPMTYDHYDLPPTSMASTRPWLPTTCAATSASES